VRVSALKCLNSPPVAEFFAALKTRYRVVDPVGEFIAALKTHFRV
jgi:hypothetical protein